MFLKRPALCVFMVAVLIFGNVMFLTASAEAQFRGGGFRGFSGSKSFGFSKSAAWTGTTRNAWNRSGGGLFGGSGSGYSKPSLPGGGGGAGYAKPSLEKRAGAGGQASEGSASSGGYSKPLSASAAGGGGFAAGSKFDKDTVNQLNQKRAQESLERYKAEQSKFKQPDYKVQGVESNPLYTQAKNYSGFDYGTYYGNRDAYYRQQGYQPASYAYNTSPAFGIFSGLFLFWMLDHASNRAVAATAYHHADDPGYKKWREEADRLAKDNTDLKAKLDDLDKQVKEMKGTPQDPSYLPPGVPPGVAIAEGVLATKKSEKPVVRLAAGQEGGWYDKFAKMFKETATGLDVKIITTTGSLENLRLLAEGKADMAVVQSDVLAISDRNIPGKDLITEQSTLYTEYAQLIANRESGIKSAADIDPAKNVVYVGPKGSGTAITWEALGNQDLRYRKIPVKYADYGAALAEVEKDPKALMFFVGGLNSEFLKKAEQFAKDTGKLRLIVLHDRKFAAKRDKHGNPAYQFVAIPGNVYPDLQKGWLFSGEVETLAVQAVLVLRTDWAKKYGPDAMDALSKAILETRPEIQRIVNRID